MATGGAHKQRGSTMLFVAGVIVPALFFMFAISVDVAIYYRENRRIQKLTDEAALYAQRYLPYRAAAAAAARACLAADPQTAQKAQVTVTGDHVEVQYEGEAPVVFGSFFKAAGATISAYSKTAGTPFDAALYLDTSSYLAPDLETGEPLNAEDGSVPRAAQYFEQVYQPAIAAGGERRPLSPLLLTQQCFNVRFSALKEALIRTYEYAASFPANQVGAFIVPGRVAGVDAIKAMGPAAWADAAGEATPSTYGGAYLNSAHCLAAAEYDTNFPSVLGSYQFLPVNEALWTAKTAPAPEPVTTGSGAGLMFNPAYAPYLSVKDAIWGCAVNRGRSSDVSALLQSIRAELTAAPRYDVRRALNRHVARRAVVLAGDLPRERGKRYPDGDVEQALSAGLAALAADAEEYRLSIEVYYVLYPVSGSGLQDAFTQLSGFLQGFQTERLRVRAILSGSRADLIQNVVGVLGVAGKNAVVWR